MEFHTAKGFIMVFDVLIFISGFFCQEIFAVEPSFDVPTVNITAIEEKQAVLPCSVEYLGGHKVVWTDQWSTLLTFDITRIIDDDRFSVERPRSEDWNLLIRDVKYADRGQYICQINTQPVKTKYVVLHVLVPPKIDNKLSSKDVAVPEGSDVTLVCNVTGIPQPTVHWHRQPLGQSPGKKREIILIEKPATKRIGHGSVEYDGIGLNGEILIIKNISRYCNGLYECFAFNDVPPAVTRGIEVKVKFKPEIKLVNKRISQYKGKETILECSVSAYPQATTVWRRLGEDIVTNWKYRVDIYKDEGDYQLTLSLRVSFLTDEDFGAYTCFAENELGADQEDMIVSEMIRTTTTTTTSTTTTTEKSTLKKYHKVPDNSRNNGYYPGKKNKTLDKEFMSMDTPSTPNVVGNVKESGHLVAGRQRDNEGIICTNSLILICQTKAASVSYLNNAQQNTAVFLCQIFSVCNVLYYIIKILS